MPYPDTLWLLDFHPLEIARQMTLIDHKLFVAIPPNELLNKHSLKSESCPFLTKLAERFNRVTSWICTEITVEANIKQRRKIISHFIIIGVKLLAMRNYAGLMSVVIGLSQYSVSRMQLTWKSVPQPLMDKWHKLESLCSPISNFKNLREIHSNSTLPSVKAPTIFLKDIAFIEENKQFLEFENKDGTVHKLWNINKIQQIGKIMAMLSDAQRINYEFQPVPILQKYLENVPFRDAATCDTFSHRNEPRSAVL